MVRNKPPSDVDNFCENFKINIDLSRFTHTYYGKLNKEDKHKVEEALNDTMTTFKNIPL